MKEILQLTKLFITKYFYAIEKKLYIKIYSQWCEDMEGWMEVSGVGAGRGGEDGGEWCWGREGWMEGRSNGERYREGGEL